MIMLMTMSMMMIFHCNELVLDYSKLFTIRSSIEIAVFTVPCDAFQIPTDIIIILCDARSPYKAFFHTAIMVISLGVIGYRFGHIQKFSCIQLLIMHISYV